MNDNTDSALPLGWIWTTIGEITQPIEKVELSLVPDKEFIYLDISSIDNSRNVIADPKIYRGKDAPSRARQLVYANDVLFSTVRTYLRNIAVVPEVYDGQIASTGFSVLRTELGIEPKYLFYYCLENNFLNKLATLQRGTSYPAIRDIDMREQQIPLAPLPEQQRIVDVIEAEFTRLDAGVAALKRLRANLKRYKAAVLKAAAEGKLVPQDPNDEPASELLERILQEHRQKWEDEQRANGRDPYKLKYEEPKAPETDNLPELPEGWVWVRAEQVCEFITKGTTPEADKMFPGEGEVPYIKVYNLTHTGYLDFTVKPTFISQTTHKTELRRSRVYPGDILMNIVGPPLGKLSLVPDTFPEWNINQAVAIFRPLQGFNRKFLLLCLMNREILAWAVKRAKATAGQFNLTLEICRDLPLPLPPSRYQEQIVQEMEKRLSIINKLESVVELGVQRGERLRQAILRDAFAGRLVAQNPNDEPASELLKRIQLARVEQITGKRKAK